MTAAVGKRSTMTLYSTNTDPYSHRCRIVLAEKGVSADIITVDLLNKPQDLLELNPYNTVPTLLDRDLVLYESRIIMEYLDERFPHPPLMPVYPVARARTRLMLQRIDNDWYSIMDEISSGKCQDIVAKRQELKDGLTTIAPIFKEAPFFLSEEYSLVDCALSVLLWRLPSLGIQLDRAAKSLVTYGQQMFERNAFQASLTEAERELGGF